MAKTGHAIEIKMQDTGEGLIAGEGGKYGYLQGFTIAGEDQKFYWAKAEITGKNTVRVYSNKVPNPVAVRYAWADNPEDANLQAINGLPAAPFRTDNWPRKTDGKKYGDNERLMFALSSVFQLPFS